MTIIELKELIIDFTGHLDYNFLCDEIPCLDCVFFNNLNQECEGKQVDYNWKKIKESNIPDDTIVTKELLKEFKIDN